MKSSTKNPWKEVPKIDGIGCNRIYKLRVYLSDFCPEYSFLILKKGTLISTGNLKRTTLYIRKKDKFSDNVSIGMKEEDYRKHRTYFK